MVLNIEMTYKAVLLNQMLEKEQQDWQLKLEDFKNAGLLKRNTIRMAFFGTVTFVSFISLMMNFAVDNFDLVNIFFKELHGFIGLFFGGLILLMLLLYNQGKKWLNHLNRKKDHDFLNCVEQLKCVQENRKTVTKMLSDKCVYPEEYQRKEVLETMLLLIKQGKAKSAEEAMQIIRIEYSYLLPK